MRKNNLIGKKFGKLTVINEASPKIEPSGKKKIMWECICECGNIRVVSSSNLTSGHTRSCGCMCGRENIIGKKYGRLTVLEYMGDSKHKCICECGNFVTVDTSNLKNGNTKSCGCLQKEKASELNYIDLTGNRYGKLTVIERLENNRYGHTVYRCKCDCGGYAIVESGSLKSGKTLSCGCIKSKGEMIINNWLNSNNINYKSQYSIDNLFYSTGRRPFFDFAIFDKHNKLLCLIEYNGKQHYGYSGSGWDNEFNFKKTQIRDLEKRKLCAENNIKLYEIPYWEIDNIDKVLEGLIKESATAPDMEESQDI